MKLYTFLVTTFAAYALLQLFVLPEVDRKWAANRTVTKLGKVGALAALKSARTLLQIALMTYGLILLLIGGLRYFTGAHSAAGYQAAIERAEGWKASLLSFEAHIAGPVTFGLAVVGLAIFAYRRHRRILVADVDR